MELLDFVGVGTKFLAGLGPDDDGRHEETRSGGKIVELTQYVRRRQFEADLFVGFAKGGFDDRFARVEASAGQRELSGMVSHLGRSARDQEAGFAVFVGGDDQGDRGGAQVGARVGVVIESGQIFADARPKMGVKVMSFESHGREA